MKTTIADPWSVANTHSNERSSSVNNCEDSTTSVAEEIVGSNDCFEDSFNPVINSNQSSEDLPRLPDSEQYLARLDSRLKAIKGGTSKRDLINSLSFAKEDCIARLITAGGNLEKPEEQELAANPIIRHIAPHLQALTANELVHLLKADALQAAVNEQNQLPENEDSESKSTNSQSDIQTLDSNGL